MQHSGSGMLLAASSSICAGIAAFYLTRASASLATRNATNDAEAYDKRQLRYRLLRQSSVVFEYGEVVIASMASTLEGRLSWVWGTQAATRLPGRLSQLLAKMILGNFREISRATDIRSIEQPWRPAELAAAGVLVGCVGAITTTLLMFRSVSGGTLFALAVIGFAVAQRLWIGRFIRRAKLRQQSVLRLLPHAVDTITMVMQAGGTFLLGLESVAKDFPGHPLSMELLRMRSRLGRGQTMRESIELTARAISLPEFDDVARILTRIHDHGAPSTDSFARLAKQMRVAHLRRMEEQVGKAESKMSLPTMLVLFSCMLVCLGPFLLTVSEIKFFN